MEVAWYQIEKELSKIGDVQHRDILDIDHVEFILNNVKFSFYACPKYSPAASSLPPLLQIFVAVVLRNRCG